MERLTFEGNFCDIAQCRDSACKQDGTCTQKQVWERLKAYEDTGLSPEQVVNAKTIIETAFADDTSKAERIRKLVAADDEGRVTILPCRNDADIVLVRNGIAFKPDHWNIHLTAFAENQPTPSGKKVALFDLSEVQESMEGKG